VSAVVLSEAQLLVSELVTNSVRHAGSPVDAPVRVRADVSGGMVRLEVRDVGHGAPVVRRARDRLGGRGFGLHLVDLLSTRWGVSGDHGTQVWFELAART
jgi:serine/threonine-protein kinase RsbW